MPKLQSKNMDSPDVDTECTKFLFLYCDFSGGREDRQQFLLYQSTNAKIKSAKSIHLPSQKYVQSAITTDVIIREQLQLQIDSWKAAPVRQISFA
jgi:hypothetical protein